MPAWISFKELRRELRFVDVLRHYKIDVKRRGDRVTAFCPLPGHPARTDGTQRTSSLSIHLGRNIFQCFGCKASGNAVEFAARMEGFDPSNAEQFRTAALKVAEIFGINTGKGTTPSESKKDAKTEAGSIEASQKAAVINAPLNFALKDLDPDHPYLSERGFNSATIEYFGLGYCNRGLMKGRIAIPIHDPVGQLVAYGGRLIDDSKISDESPKYRLPGDRQHGGVLHQFRKSLLLYNFHRIRGSAGSVADLIVVEGFPSTWWLHQCNYPNVVALMGSDCSDEQAQLIVRLTRPHGIVWIMPDGNEAGRQCALSLLERISPHRLVRWICLSHDQQPTDLSSEELHQRLDLWNQD
jgi:DNA primase